MRRSIFLFAVFFLWVIGCAYYYTVHINGDNNLSTEAVITPDENETNSQEKTQQQMEAYESTFKIDTLQVPEVFIESGNRKMTIYYPEGNGRLRFNEKIMSSLNLAADALLEFNGGANIIAHTDNQGDPKDQFELGKKYANMIKDIFLSRGINSKNLRASSMGATQPIGSNSTQKGRAENRRIVIIYNN